MDSPSTQHSGGDSRMGRIPKIVVFDLDDTLWPFDVDGCQYTYPFKKGSEGKVVDSRGKIMDPFRHSISVLKALYEKGIRLGVASRTTFPEGANTLVDLYGWSPFIEFRQIYPGSKVVHFGKIEKQSRVAYQDMVFFDNENRNIMDVSKLGVTCILVDSYKGITPKDLEEGLKQFRAVKNYQVNNNFNKLSVASAAGAGGRGTSTDDD